MEAELHRAKFERVLERHPTPGRSLLDACVTGTVNLIDCFALPGEGFSRLLIDAVEKGQEKVVHTMLRTCANPNYRSLAGETALCIAGTRGSVAIASSLIKAGANVDLALNSNYRCLGLYPNCCSYHIQNKSTYLPEVLSFKVVQAN